MTQAAPVRADTFLDTGVLLYATAPNDRRCAAAMQALAAGGVTSRQVLSEFTAIAYGQLGLSWPDVCEALSIFRVLCPKPITVGLSTYERALQLVDQESLVLQDALIAASAMMAGCSRLLSGMAEDGRVLGDQLVVCNPFGLPPKNAFGKADSVAVSDAGALHPI